MKMGNRKTATDKVFEVYGSTGLYESQKGMAQCIEFNLEVPTLQEAREIASAFPKWLKVKAWTITYGEYSGSDHPRGEFGVVHLEARLLSDGANGGVNETGIKRARKFASMVGFAYKRATCGNWMPEKMVDEILGGK